MASHFKYLVLGDWENESNCASFRYQFFINKAIDKINLYAIGVLQTCHIHEPSISSLVFVKLW